MKKLDWADKASLRFDNKASIAARALRAAFRRGQREIFEAIMNDLETNLRESYFPPPTIAAMFRAGRESTLHITGSKP